MTRDPIVIQDPYRYYKNALIKHSDAAIHRVLVRELTKVGSTGWSKHNATNITVFIFILSVWQCLAVECTAFMTRGLLASPKKFSYQESWSKISNLMMTELFYPHIFDINRGSIPHKRFYARTPICLRL